MELKERVIKWFDKRGISERTLVKFMIFTKEEFMPQNSQKKNCICFPYFKDSEILNIKYRDSEKNFKVWKDAELIFYNLNAIVDKKIVVITEGEIDAMSVYEAGFGQDYEELNISKETDAGKLIEETKLLNKIVAVSVPNGASKGNQSLKYLDNCAEYFIGLDEIIIATDNDEAGILLKDELTKKLGIERCKTITYPVQEVVPLESNLKRPCKDLNEVLVYFGKEGVKMVINNAHACDFIMTNENNNRKGVELLIQKIESLEIDITGNFKKWRNIGFALANEFNSSGEIFFHRISCYHKNYKAELCSELYKECCKKRKLDIGIDTLFSMAKDFGIYLLQPGQSMHPTSTLLVKL